MLGQLVRRRLIVTGRLYLAFSAALVFFFCGVGVGTLLMNPKLLTQVDIQGRIVLGSISAFGVISIGLWQMLSRRNVRIFVFFFFGLSMLPLIIGVFVRMCFLGQTGVSPFK